MLFVILARGKRTRASAGIQHKTAEGALIDFCDELYAGFPAFGAPAAHSAENDDTMRLAAGSRNA